LIGSWLPDNVLLKIRRFTNRPFVMITGLLLTIPIPGADDDKILPGSPFYTDRKMLPDGLIRKTLEGGAELIYR